MDFWTVILLLITLFVMLIGLFGTVLPFLPGAPLIFVMALVYALLTDFDPVTGNTILWLAGLTALALIIDWVTTSVGATRKGGSKFGAIGAALGMLVGVIVGGPIGAIVGAFVGAFGVEFAISSDHRKAFDSGVGSLVGFFVGGVMRITIAATMIGIFLWRVLFS